MDEHSPYARSLKKSNSVFKYGMDYDDEYDLINSDPSKPAGDHIKDENLSVKQLKMRYAGIFFFIYTLFFFNFEEDL